jgi:hypothetical protein
MGMALFKRREICKFPILRSRSVQLISTVTETWDLAVATPGAPGNNYDNTVNVLLGMGAAILPRR